VVRIEDGSGVHLRASSRALERHFKGDDWMGLRVQRIRAWCAAIGVLPSSPTDRALLLVAASPRRGCAKVG